ncbi:Ankyrin repeat domain-containing protein 13C [Irineochytrium annulatum]|nr:Ankyrin repeat domain-containing protein 13C [Irineochytrium annulatum]
MWVAKEEARIWKAGRKDGRCGGTVGGEPLLASSVVDTLLQDVKDFYLEMHWQFQSWIPFVSQLCPSDTYKVYKKGTSVRIDTTLVGFERLSWIRGNISIIFSETPEGPRLVICDHQRNLVQQVYPRDFTLTDQDVEEELSVSLNTNILVQIAPPEIDFQSFNLSRAQNGFWTFKVDRNEKVGPWDTQVWNVECLEFVNRVRTEHLDVEPLPEMVRRERKSAAAKAAPPPAKKPPPRGLVIVNADADDEAWASEATENAKQIDESDDWSQAKRHFHELAAFRGSLEPPAPTTMTADEFFDESKKDVHLHVGRPKVEKSTSKGFKATIWVYNGEGGPPKSVDAPPVPLSENGAPPSTTGPPAIQSSAFPIELSTLLPLLDLIGMGSNQHMRSLREFFNVQLPPGFPVKVEIPVNMLPLSAVITFQNINTSVDMPQEMFNIPGKKEGYRAGEVVRGSTEGTAS